MKPGDIVHPIEDHDYLNLKKEDNGEIIYIDVDSVAVRFKTRIILQLDEVELSQPYIKEEILLKNENSASKNDKEKVDLSLIPLISDIEHAKAFMVGEKKYGRYNYCKGHKVSQLVAAILRHAKAYMNGEEFDKIDGQHHLGSVMACCSMLLRQKELGTLKDDRYKENKKDENT